MSITRTLRVCTQPSPQLNKKPNNPSSEIMVNSNSSNEASSSCSRNCSIILSSAKTLLLPILHITKWVQRGYSDLGLVKALSSQQERKLYELYFIQLAVSHLQLSKIYISPSEFISPAPATMSCSFPRIKSNTVAQSTISPQ